MGRLNSITRAGWKINENPKKGWNLRNKPSEVDHVNIEEPAAVIVPEKGIIYHTSRRKKGRLSELEQDRKSRETEQT